MESRAMRVGGGAGRSRAFRRGAVLAGTVLLGLALVPAWASPPIWKAEGEGNRLWLAGSLHYLREDDYPLPEALMRAYREADALVLESNPHEQREAVRAATLTGRVPRASRIEPAGPLRRYLSSREFAGLRKLAESRGYDAFQLDKLHPWFAAMYVLDTELSEGGFQAELGLDAKLLEYAQRDGKPVAALDTMQEKRELFDSIPRDEQVAFLIGMLRDASYLAASMERLVGYWHDGDVPALEGRLLNRLMLRPDEYQRFAVDRNARWIERIEPLLGDDQDYLVVVGVLHLLGPDSLVALLRERGYRVEAWPSGEQ